MLEFSGTGENQTKQGAYGILTKIVRTNKQRINLVQNNASQLCMTIFSALTKLRIWHAPRQCPSCITWHLTDSKYYLLTIYFLSLMCITSGTCFKATSLTIV